MFVDTGVLLAVGHDQRCADLIAQRYAGRLHVADLVVRELSRKARAGSTDLREVLVRAAAVCARTVLLDSKAAVVDTMASEDAPVFDSVLNQLVNLPRRDGGTAHPDEHTGEAASIAIAVRYLRGGDRVVFLTNDGNAGRAAMVNEIPTRHFGHVLAELACAGDYSAEEAFLRFQFANKVSAIGAASSPTSTADFTCHGSQDTCARCDRAWHGSLTP